MNKNQCPFCDPSVDPSMFGENHIFGNGRFHVVAGKGQMTDGGYVVIFPAEHIPCLGAMRESDVEDFSLLVETAADILSREYGDSPVTVFEHGVAGEAARHGHIHLVPAKIDLLGRVKTDFAAAEIDVVGSLGNLARSFAKNPENYFLVSEISAKDLLWACWNLQAEPLYLRRSVAELLKHPERANWREYCDSERDRELRLQTVARLKPHFL